MIEIGLTVAAALVIAYLIWDKLDRSPGRDERPPSPDAGLPPRSPHLPPTEPPTPHPPEPPVGLPDREGRVRIPEVEALGGDWARCWWVTPWPLRDPAVRALLDPVTVWQIRWACMCDAEGNVTPAAYRGYDTHDGFGDSLYCIWVPRLYRKGVDKAGRPGTIWQASSDDTVLPSGQWKQALWGGEPLRMIDKFTRATTADTPEALVAYIRDNNIDALPEPNGDWDGGVG